MEWNKSEFGETGNQLILPLFEGSEKAPNNALSGLSRSQRSLVREAIASDDFEGKKGQRMAVWTPGCRVLLAGMGKKTAMLLIVLTDGFTGFENARQLCCYAGITPTIRQSGISVRGRSRISKVGNRKLRNLLFMCSFTACKTNKACKELYDRIVEKGKSKKLALIAVCNKLLKQAFAIAKSGTNYQENYMSKLA